MIKDFELKERLTVKQVFSQYFKVKFLLFLTVFIIITVNRYIHTHRGIEWDLLAEAFGCLMFGVAVLGYMDYYFYEKTAKKIILKMLCESPLKEFDNIGFVDEYDEKNKISGYINGFKVILAPLVNSQRKKFLTILIPLKVQGEAEKYFTNIDDIFKFAFTGEILMTQAVIENFTQHYDFEKLFNLLTRATDLLIERKIEPIEIMGD